MAIQTRQALYQDAMMAIDELSASVLSAIDNPRPSDHGKWHKEELDLARATSSADYIRRTLASAGKLMMDDILDR